MTLKSRLETALIFFTALIIFYSYITTSETFCFDRFTMILSLFSLVYAIFLKII